MIRWLFKKIRVIALKIQKHQIRKLLQYLIFKNRCLPYSWPDSYDSDDQPYREECLDIVHEIIPTLFRAGKKSLVLKITPINTTSLSPLYYQGKISWKCHFVCVCDNIAYDPLNTCPLSLEEYFKKTFGVPVKTEIAISSEALWKQQQLVTRLYHSLVSRLVSR